MRKLVVIGCGHWGKNHVRLFADLLGPERVAAVDASAGALAGVRGRHHGVSTHATLDEALKANACAMAVVATPAGTHFDVIGRCLAAGLDVLAEKPMTLDVAQAETLAAAARRQGRILMVGHTFLYNPAIRKIRALIRQGTCGDIYYMKAARTHLGLVRPDVNAVWDLAPHDVAIFNYLTGSVPVSVSAMGGCFLKKGKEDVAFINLQYPKGIVANIHVSWADSNKERTVVVVGSRARVVFDDLNALERVKIYEKGISSRVAGGATFCEFMFALRDGRIVSPKIQMAEPLMEVCKEFLRWVRTRREPLTGAQDGVAVVKVMCAVEASLKAGGKCVPVE